MHVFKFDPPYQISQRLWIFLTFRFFSYAESRLDTAAPNSFWIKCLLQTLRAHTDQSTLRNPSSFENWEEQIPSVNLPGDFNIDVLHHPVMLRGSWTVPLEMGDLLCMCMCVSVWSRVLVKDTGAVGEVRDLGIGSGLCVIGKVGWEISRTFVIGIRSSVTFTRFYLSPETVYSPAFSPADVWRMSTTTCFHQLHEKGLQKQSQTQPLCQQCICQTLSLIIPEDEAESLVGPWCA